MGSAAFRKEIKDTVAALPPPPTFTSVQKDGEDEFDAAVKAYRKRIFAWRARMLEFVPKLEAIFERASANPADLRYLLDVAMPEVMAAVDEQLDLAIKQIEIPQNIRSRMDFVAKWHPASRGLVRKMEKSWRNAAIAYRDMLVDLRDRLLIVEWDHDPDARDGRAFDSADELIASL